MQGYKYTTKQDAINAVKACNDYYGIPKSATDVTQNWCAYSYSELDDFWYITFDVSLQPILGEPIDFEITQNDFNTVIEKENE
jgi:hypothetical protein